MGILSAVPQSLAMSSWRCLTVLSHDASANRMYSLIETLCPDDEPATPCTVELTQSLDVDPRPVECKTPRTKRVPAASQSICVARLGLLVNELCFMTAC